MRLCRVRQLVLLTALAVSCVSAGAQRWQKEDDPWRYEHGLATVWVPRCDVQGNPLADAPADNKSPARHPAAVTSSAASSYGTPAGNFGESVDTLAGVAQRHADKVAAEAEADSLDAPPVLAHAYDPTVPDVALLSARLHSSGQLENARIYTVPCGHLSQHLDAAKGTETAPDLLVGHMPRGWMAEGGKTYLLPREVPADTPQSLFARPPHDPPSVFLLLKDAPNPRYARALYVALTEPSQGRVPAIQPPRPLRDGEDNPTLLARFARADARYRVRIAAAEAAEAALNILVHGDPLGPKADPDAAGFFAPAGMLLGVVDLTSGAPQLVDSDHLRIDILSSELEGPLAVVRARVVTDGPHAFGLTHPLLVLRRPEGDAQTARWLVLHVTLNPEEASAERASLMLLAGSPRSSHEAADGVHGVRLASPPEGDARAPRPDLLWDNLGGAGLQVVEWQTRQPNGWSNPHLFLVPDTYNRLQTRVTADFATGHMTYRWRVWSLGAGGANLLSPWRTFRIQPN